MLKRRTIPIIKECARSFGITTFIETGTFYGDMVFEMKDNFEKIISIELDYAFAYEAQRRFEQYGHITIIQGDSGIVLEEVLIDIYNPCIFWLDSHYSGGYTAKGNKYTPIMDELKHIFNHQVRDHVVVIDDIVDFNGENDYPTFKELKNYIMKHRPDWNIRIEDDIIRKFAVCSRNQF